MKKFHICLFALTALAIVCATGSSIFLFSELSKENLAFFYGVPTSFVLGVAVLFKAALYVFEDYRDEQKLKGLQT